MDIKVEPLNPGIFSAHSSGSNDRMRVPTKTENDSALYDQVSDYIPPQQSDPTYKYQSTSMPVFPNMPYSSAYPYVPIRPAPSQTVQVSPQYPLATSGVSDPYDVDEEKAFEEKVPRNSTGIIGKRSHLPKRYKCAMCAYRTRYKSDLNRHVRKHAIATFNCDICNMPFKTVGNVEFHKRKEHSGLLPHQTTSANDVIKYNCKMCPYGSQYSSDLTRHVRKHYVAKFHCQVCNKPFMTSGSLASHKRSAHEAKPDDTDASSLVAHDGNSESDFDSADLNSVDVNGNDKEDLEFDEDDMEDETRDKHDDSIIVVSENSYSYEEPDIETAPIAEGINISSGSVASEKHSEADDSKHSCPYCNKTFGRKLVLEHHMKDVHRVNGDEKGDFVNFNKDYDLALDMSIQEMESSPVQTPRATSTNTGPLRHKCPFCAYATNYKSTYDRHVRKHELLCHICNVCRMPFITFGHLQRHIRDNHPDHNQQISKKEVTIEKQTCSYCEFEADSLEQLRIHCEAKHGQVIAQEVHRSGTKKTHTKVQNTPVTSNVLAEAQSGNGDKAMHLSTTTNTGQGPSHEKPIAQNQKDMKILYNVPKTESQMEEGVYTYPPTSGRYAKLVSDFDDFAAKPFACSLCFFRCSDVHSLITHAENHLTGCNPFHVPETARFTTGPDGISENAENLHYISPSEKPTSISDINKPVFPSPVPVQMNFTPPNSGITSRTSPASVSDSIDVISSYIKREPSSNRRKSSMPTRLRQTPQPIRPGQQSPRHAPQSPIKSINSFKEVPTTKLNIDRLIPTFSVHYRKDKTNPAKPYLCLMCRKRFRHLPMLKQHFRQVHNENGSANNQKFECEPCNLTFNTPMALQEHHEIHH